MSSSTTAWLYSGYCLLWDVLLDEIAVEGLLAQAKRFFGTRLIWPDSLRTKFLHQAARKAGITKRIGWHTFRHTNPRSWFDE